MLSVIARSPHASSFPTVFIRSLATEIVSSSSSDLLPPPLPKPKPSRSRLHPQPRPVTHRPRQALPTLPPTFGRNQLLPVSNNTRALLESIVDQFDAPIRYAFAYGSGVFEQDGYPLKSQGVDAPMLDFMFAVTHPAHFHSINMHQHPSHYTLHARLFGSSYVTKVEEIAPGVWFNAFVPMAGVVSLIFKECVSFFLAHFFGCRQSNTV